MEMRELLVQFRTENGYFSSQKENTTKALVRDFLRVCYWVTCILTTENFKGWWLSNNLWQLQSD